MAQHATSPDSWIADRLREPQQRFREFAQKAYAGGALDLKTKELIAVACSSVVRCPHCTDEHLAKAKEVGATEEEVAEALAVAWAQGGGTQVFWMYEDFDELLGEGWRQQFMPEAGRDGGAALVIGRDPGVRNETAARSQPALVQVIRGGEARLRGPDDHDLGLDRHPRGRADRTRYVALAEVGSPSGAAISARTRGITSRP